jgi:hypothetical protein
VIVLIAHVGLGDAKTEGADRRPECGAVQPGRIEYGMATEGRFYVCECRSIAAEISMLMGLLYSLRLNIM